MIRRSLGISLLLAVFLMSPLAMAKKHKGHCDRKDCKKNHAEYIDKKIAKMDKKLNLTDEQEKKIRGFLEEKMEKKHEAYKEMRKKKDAIREEYQKNIASVLNDDQQKQYDAWKKSKKKKKGKHGDCKKCKH